MRSIRRPGIEHGPYRRHWYQWHINRTDEKGVTGPRRVLFIDDAPILGGAELLGLRLAIWMQRERPGEWHPEFVCPAASALAERCRRAGITVHPLDFPDLGPRGLRHMPGAIRRLAAILRGARRDGALAVATTARAQAYAAIARLDMRAAPVVNLLLEQETAARASARLVLRRTGRLVAIGENTAAAYRAAVPGVPIKLLNNVVDPAMLSRTSSRTARPAGNALPVIGCLGRLVPQKGVLELVDEAADAHDSWSRLVIVGDAQSLAYAQRLSERIEALGLAGRTEVRGFVEDTEQFFSEIDVLIVPSTGTEGQPTVIVEALAHGLAVVVRRPIWSPDFSGLPVLPYSDGGELAAALREASALPPAPARELRQRFGPEQAMSALVIAAS